MRCDTSRMCDCDGECGECRNRALSISCYCSPGQLFTPRYKRYKYTIIYLSRMSRVGPSVSLLGSSYYISISVCAYLPFLYYVCCSRGKKGKETRLLIVLLYTVVCDNPNPRDSSLVCMCVCVRRAYLYTTLIMIRSDF